MGAAVLAGCGLGVGVALLLAAVWPSRRSLAGSLALLRASPPPEPAAEPDAGLPGWQARVGHAVAELSRPLGIEYRTIRVDLAVLDRPLDAHLARKTLWAAGAGLAGASLGGVAASQGVAGSVQVPAWLALACALLGFTLPDRQVRAAARAHRASMRYAVGALLNLAAVNLAGGAEVEEAVANATRLGDGWAFALLRHSLDRARLGGEKVWAVWAQLGEQLGIPELKQLAQQLTIAGDEGARMRQALVAMAGQLRRHELAEAEVRAGEASEHMVLPLALLAGGFLVLLLFPAASQVLGTLGS